MMNLNNVLQNAKDPLKVFLLLFIFIQLKVADEALTILILSNDIGRELNKIPFIARLIMMIVFISGIIFLSATEYNTAVVASTIAIGVYIVVVANNILIYIWYV